MTFFHLTDPDVRAPAILRDGVIRTSESNVGSPSRTMQPYGEHFGPDVVWLLDSLPSASVPMANGLSVPKQHYVFEVDVPTIRWIDWEWTHRMNPSWRSAFVNSGGGPALADHWYVFPAPIRQSRWVNHYARKGA